jgi:hypothetical protein
MPSGGAIDMTSTCQEVESNKEKANTKRETCISVDIYATAFFPNFSKRVTLKPKSSGRAIKYIELIILPPHSYR